MPPTDLPTDLPSDLPTEVRADLRRKGAATRERILGAASRLFAVQGFDATSVEAIAEAADITVPGMYRHFATKHVLLLRVARWATRTSQARQALVGGADHAAGLADLFAEYLAPGELERRRLSIELSRAALQNHELRDAVGEFNALLRDSLTEMFTAGDAGRDPAEAALLAHLFLVLLMGAIHLDTLDAERIGDPALIEFLQQRFRAILADPGSVPARRPRVASAIADAVTEPEPTDGRRARTVRTRRRILDSAEELFALRGYDGTTTEAIASRAEITVPGLYRHVTTKEALLVEVAKRALSRYRLAGRFRDDIGVADQMADLIVAFSTRTDRVSRRLAIELDFGAWRSAGMADDLRAFHRRVRRNLSVALAAEQGTEPGPDHDLAALVMLMLFMGVAHLDTVDPSLLDNRAWADLLRRRVPQLVG
ncbi:TetR/AcrR family transcriptional regulator [Desertimonas flava]|uniref:TetR/AcrR family transcriptional regulator n=1 Tax=Desertimonas flava TaxID=2064846 RepID=UPI0013C52216|nr:TetR/AcrR family transcriptional regulator [Desertimonas flava]